MMMIKLMIKAPWMMTLTGSSLRVNIKWTMIRTELRPNRWMVHCKVLLIYDFEQLTQRSHWRSYRTAQKPKTPLKSPKKWDPPELALNKKSLPGKQQCMHWWLPTDCHPTNWSHFAFLVICKITGIRIVI